MSLERKIQRQNLMKEHKKAHNGVPFNKIWKEFKNNQKKGKKQ